jgi:hypothetical protein
MFLSKFFKQYQIYRDSKNKAFATVISNSDLNGMGINTNGSNYRIVSQDLDQYKNNILI